MSVGIIKKAPFTLKLQQILSQAHAKGLPLSERGCASHARPETMTETLRSSKFPGKVSSWAWDWRGARKRRLRRERKSKGMRQACVRARSQSSTLVYHKSRWEDPAANACKYLFTFGFPLVSPWNLQQQVGRCVKTRIWAPNFPGIYASNGTGDARVCERVSFRPVPCAKQLFLQSCCRSGPVGSNFFLEHVRNRKGPWAEVIATPAQPLFLRSEAD